MTRLEQYSAAVTNALAREAEGLKRGAPFSDADERVGFGVHVLNPTTWSGDPEALTRLRSTVTKSEWFSGLIRARIDALNPRVQTVRDAVLPSVLGDAIELVHVHAVVDGSLRESIESLMSNYDAWSQVQAKAVAPISDFAMEWKLALDHAENHPTNALLDPLIQAKAELELDKEIERVESSETVEGEVVDLASWGAHLAQSKRHQQWAEELTRRASQDRLAASTERAHAWRAERKIAGSAMWSLYVRFFDSQIEVVYLGPESSRPTDVGVGTRIFDHTQTVAESDGVIEMVWTGCSGAGPFWADFVDGSIESTDPVDDVLFAMRPHGVA